MSIVLALDCIFYLKYIFILCVKKKDLELVSKSKVFIEILNKRK